MNYKIINFWNDNDILYVNYKVENLATGNTANAINYFNISDLDCSYNSASVEEIEHSLLKLIERNKGIEFNLPKVSELSPLLKYVYNFVCESESNMCHIDNNDWKDLKNEYSFSDNDILTLQDEIEKYNLNDYLTINDNEYMICGYGGLQTRFNDDRVKEYNQNER